MRVLLTVLLLTSFLIVSASYNSGPYFPIFLGLIDLAKDYHPDFAPNDYLSQFLFCGVIIIALAFVDNKRLLVFNVLILNALLFYWIYKLRGVLDFGIISCIPFWIASIVVCYLAFKSKYSSK